MHCKSRKPHSSMHVNLIREMLGWPVAHVWNILQCNITNNIAVRNINSRGGSISRVHSFFFACWLVSWKLACIAKDSHCLML
jgi:hypothetical protein